MSAATTAHFDAPTPRAGPAQGRAAHIDTVRFIACVLLISFHVVGADGDSGLGLASGPWRSANDVLASIRMPLFTFLSGIVYAYRPFTGDARTFLTKKARRLLLPMLSVGTLFAVCQAVVSGVHYDWTQLHIVPVAYFWFLESLLVVFAIVVILEALSLLATPLRFVAVWVAASTVLVAGFEAVAEVHVFSVRGTVLLTPFFLAGVGYTRFDLSARLRLGRWTAAAALAALVIGLGSVLWGAPPKGGSPVGFALGVGVCVLVVHARPHVPLLARIGASSYAIYLFHGFFVSFAHSGVATVTLHPVPHVLGGVGLSLAGGLVVESVLGRYRWSATVFLGQALRPRHRPMPFPDERPTRRTSPHPELRLHHRQAPASRIRATTDDVRTWS